MKPAGELALKGEGVDEWLDLRFFRPVGLRIARALEPTSVSADQVTLGSLAVGVAGAHLLVYERPAWNVAGLALVVIADVLDCADGQLARLRGATTRWGRILDGYVDTLRWVAVYVHLAIRLAWGGWGSGADAALLAASAGFAHSLQAAAIDFIQGAWLRIVERRGEVDLPEDLATMDLRAPAWAAITRLYYPDYVRRQAALFPRTVGLLRRLRGREAPPALREAWAAEQRRPMRASALMGENAHVLALAVAVLAGRPALFFWIELVGMLPLFLVLLFLHERGATWVSAREAPM